MRAHFSTGLGDGLMLTVEGENDDERLLLRYFFRDALEHGLQPGGCSLGGMKDGYHEIRIYTKDPRREETP